jgi:choline dehydrogenase
MDSDYVIVGGGSAGCVLAARLSEDPDTSVLLLEAGPPDVKENIHVPLGYLQLARTDVDWDYYSAPEPNCDGRRIPLPRGKVLGGSSSINAMIYIRGNRADYDGWGIEGWAWDDLFPYFLKAEDNERGASEWHGAGGPLSVSDQRSGNRITPAFVEAGVEAGLARNEDFNGAE